MSSLWSVRMLGEVVELVDLLDQRRVVLVEEAADVGERLVERAERVVEVR